MENIVLNKIYHKLEKLEREVEEMRHALIPEEKVSTRELAELKRIVKEMERGRKFPTEEVLGS